MSASPGALASPIEVNENSEELGQRDIARPRPTCHDMIIGLLGQRTHSICRRRHCLCPRTRRKDGLHHLQSRHASGRGGRHRHRRRCGFRSDLGFDTHEISDRAEDITNMIATDAMTCLGYVYENLMVNVDMHTPKLVARGIGILMRACHITCEKGR